ncbi:DUF2523 family protein [Photobacterium halotolerans]|uniref:DUF2523 domain-containing protein n=1 Tax=Photobacterium halotolerans TaxID=265726 RepID=A0A7X4W826_9GAMM|nr:DUF2523 family protein [Photobacterium halotolerans]NAW63911.1 DUF2523 domain-containing protein [Photobacterium halotolerans]
MYDWIIDLFNMLLNFLYNLVVSLITMLKDLVYFMLEQLLEASKALVGMIANLLTPIDMSQYFTGLPSSIGWVFGQVGLPQAIAMIITAITIRLILQLIPFTRLGS